MFEITMQEKEIERNEDDSDQEEKEVKVIIEPQIKLIWWINGLTKWREESEARGDNFTFFSEELHSAISIQDRIDKEKNKGIKEDEVFSRINEHYFFFDNHHIYKIDKRNKTLHTFYDQNIAGIFLSDNNYLYTLSHKRPDKNIGSGFRLYDVWNCIQTGQDLSYPLSRVQVGCQPLIDFSQKN